jgi:hypothetical protein
VKIVAIMPVRNEDWVLGLSARALLRWVDHLVILVHASTDRTLDIVTDLYMADKGRISVIYIKDPVWREMAHRQELLTRARLNGATHIVTIDADEVLSGNLVKHARLMVEDIPAGMVLQLPWITCRDSIYNQHGSGLWSEQHASCGFVDNPRLHWQARNGYDFHQRAPMGLPEVPFRPVTHAGGGILHLQYSSRRRLLAKQALYKMTEVVRWPGRDTVATINQRYDWSVYGAPRRPEDGNPRFDLAPVPVQWWEGYEDLQKYLDVDAEPWQERECQRLWETHGPAKFAGLDLFGVVDA